MGYTETRCNLNRMIGGNSLKDDFSSVIRINHGGLNDKALDGKRGTANNHKKVTRRWGSKNACGDLINTTFRGQYVGGGGTQVKSCGTGGGPNKGGG